MKIVAYIWDVTKNLFEFFFRFENLHITGITQEMYPIFFSFWNCGI